MSPPKPSIENTQKLRAAGLAPAKLGSFVLDAKLGADKDKQVSMRGANTLQSPTNGSFAQYLGQTLSTELQAAGLLDDAANTVIKGTLLKSEVDAAIGTGKGVLAARFEVNREGKQRYARDLEVQAEWESSFIAATAIPLAAGQYEGLYRTLVTKLLDDAEFRQALKKD